MTSLKINVRDRRLRGGVLNLSAHTDKPKVRDAREAIIRALLDNGDGDVVEMIRTRRLHIADVQAAVRRGALAALKPKAEAAAVLTLEHAIAKVLKSVKATKEASTYREYVSYGNLLKQHFGPKRALGDVSADQAQDFIHGPKTRGKPWAASRMRQMRTFARRVWAAGGADGDPFVGVELPKVRTTRHAFLQPAEWQALYASVEGTPSAVLFALSVLAGLRIMESANLRVGIDVDLDRNVLHIQPRTGEYRWRPKSDNGVRDVPIRPRLRAIIVQHMESGFSGERYLIRVAKRDRPASYATLQNWTEAAFKAVGLRYGVEGDGLTHHSLRHTFASWAAQQNEQIVKIAKLIGDTVETTAKHYLHLVPGDLETTADVVEGVAWRRAA